MKDFKGFSLFNDVEDAALRTRNRAVILRNIVEQNTRDAKVTQKGSVLAIGYFNCIPEIERKDVLVQFEKFLKESGYVTTSTKTH